MCPCRKRGGKKVICCPFCGLAEVSAGKGDRKLSFLSKEVPTERSAFGCCVTEVVGISASFFFHSILAFFQLCSGLAAGAEVQPFASNIG